MEIKSYTLAILVFLCLTLFSVSCSLRPANQQAGNPQATIEALQTQVARVPQSTPTSFPGVTAATIVPSTVAIENASPTPVVSNVVVSADDLEMVKKGLIRCRVSQTSAQQSSDYFALFEMRSKRDDIFIGANGKLSLIGPGGMILDSADSGGTFRSSRDTVLVIPDKFYDHNPLSSGGSKVEDIRIDFPDIHTLSPDVVPDRNYDITLSSYNETGSIFPSRSIRVAITNKTDSVFNFVRVRGAVFDSNGNLVDILSNGLEEDDSVPYEETKIFTAYSLSATGRCAGPIDSAGYTLDYEVLFATNIGRVDRSFTTRVK